VDSDSLETVSSGKVSNTVKIIIISVSVSVGAIAAITLIVVIKKCCMKHIQKQVNPLVLIGSNNDQLPRADDAVIAQQRQIQEQLEVDRAIALSL